MKKFFPFAFAVLCFAFKATMACAQIVYTSSDFITQQLSLPSSARSTSDDRSVLQSLIARTGPNQTWTFGGSSWCDPSTSELLQVVFPFPGKAPEANQFQGATHVFAISGRTQAKSYNFWKITDAGASFFGSVQDNSGKTTVSRVSAPGESIVFPLTYQTSWYRKSVSGQEWGSIHGLVVGYGTLVLPSGSYEALMVYSRDTGTDGVCMYVRDEYEWLTKTGHHAMIAIELDHQGRIGGSYEIPATASSSVSRVSTGLLNLRVSQNPASNSETKLSYTLSHDGPVQVMMMDALGRDVKMLVRGIGHRGENDIAIDPSTLANGSYFLHVNAQGQTAVVKLQIAK